MAFDAIVVGARCAGSTTARLLSQRGLSVLVVDRATFPSDTVSTHCVTSGGVGQLRRWGLLESVLDTNAPLVGEFTMSVGGMEMTNPLGSDPLQATVSPRRTVLDKLLVDAAIEAGAEVREGVTLNELLRDGDRVVGITGQTSAGTIEERAAIIIGADGIHSSVAAQAGADQYDTRAAYGSGYYSYFSGWPGKSVELGFRDGNFAGVFPTNDGQTCVFAGRNEEDFSTFKGDVDAGHQTILTTVNPRLAEWIGDSKREERWYAFRATPGFMRKPFGPGWALVGDAGLHQDPVTGHGITAAFRDAELLANAVSDGLGGREPLDAALASYHATRDEISKDVYASTQAIAALGWTDEEVVPLFGQFGQAAELERQRMAAWP